VRDADPLEVLSNETRRKILRCLLGGPKYQSELVKEVGVRQQALIRHLAVLEDMGIIRSWTEPNAEGAARRYYDLSGELIFLKELQEVDLLNDDYFPAILQGLLGGPEAIREELRRLRKLEEAMNKILKSLRQKATRDGVESLSKSSSHEEEVGWTFFIVGVSKTLYITEATGEPHSDHLFFIMTGEDKNRYRAHLTGEVVHVPKIPRLRAKVPDKPRPQRSLGGTDVYVRTGLQLEFPSPAYPDNAAMP